MVGHNSDRKTSGRLAPAQQELNALIVDTAGRNASSCSTLISTGWRDCQGHRHKPEHAWREFAERPAAEMPGQLVRAAELTMSFVTPPAETP